MGQRKSPSQVHCGLKWGKRKYPTEAHKKANSIKWWDIIIKMAPRPHQSTSIMLWYKESKPVNRKGNQCWMFTGRTDAEAEALILWPPDVKNWLIGKDPVAGKDWRQEEETTEDEMVGWHHQLDGHEFEHTLGDGEGQGGLAGCGPWGCKESRYNWASELNWTDSQRVIKAKKNEPQTCLNSL